MLGETSLVRTTCLDRLELDYLVGFGHLDENYSLGLLIPALFYLVVCFR